MEQLADTLINAQIKSITAIRRTYEEDPHTAKDAGQGGGAAAEEGDHLNGYAINAPGGMYVAYPFEIQFETKVENFRDVISGLIQSPYVFIVRTLSVKNSSPNSPALNDLDRMAGTPPSSVVDTSPGRNGRDNIDQRPAIPLWQLDPDREDAHRYDRVDRRSGRDHGRRCRTGRQEREERWHLMKPQSPEPIILAVALVLLALGAGALAYLYPSVEDITHVTTLQPPAIPPSR